MPSPQSKALTLDNIKSELNDASLLYEQNAIEIRSDVFSDDKWGDQRYFEGKAEAYQNALVMLVDQEYVGL